MPIKTVLYVSKGAGARSRTHVRLFAPKARVANQSADITSTLVLDGRNYAGLLEGPTKAVDALMARIAMDQRHSKLRVVFDHRGAKRSYVGVPLSYTYEERHRPTISECVSGSRVPMRQLIDVLGVNFSPTGALRL